MRQQTRMPVIALYGGSFDPVHNGHVAVVRSIRNILAPDQLHIIPCHLPAHKAALKASNADRVTMLHMAMDDIPGVTIDQRELTRETLSYTYDTVCEIRQELSRQEQTREEPSVQEYSNQVSLCFVIGWDSWLSFTTWYKWREILQEVNLVVVRRPGFGPEYDAEPEDDFSEYFIRLDELAQHRNGKVLMLQTDELDIASKAIRSKVANHESIHDFVPEPVAEYIHSKTLYMPH